MSIACSWTGMFGFFLWKSSIMAAYCALRSSADDSNWAKVMVTGPFTVWEACEGDCEPPPQAATMTQRIAVAEIQAGRQREADPFIQWRTPRSSYTAVPALSFGTPPPSA